jgi:cytochrome c-type biogenesis protein CcmH
MRGENGGRGGDVGRVGQVGRVGREPGEGVVTRRGLFQAFAALAGIAGGSAVLPGLEAQTGAQAADSAARRRAAAGRLADPTVAGRPRQPTSSADNDVAIQELEKRLRCGCGCTLDVYTCRTTDFTCTYSPELHREVIALWDDGKSADEIVEAFVAKYGEEALMAPEPEGFNLAGYLVPGVVVTGLGATLLWVLSRRARIAGAAGAAGASVAAGPAAGTGAPSAFPTTRAAPTLTDDDLALVQKALAEDEER